MIFGFNTDVKHGETVYHVQSEARESELLLQTQVFVRGRCIGKRTTSYAREAAGNTFGDQQKEQILRDQHRLVLNAIREDQLENILDRQDTGSLATIKQLDVLWLNADSVHTGNALTMRLQVTEDGSGVPGARLVVRFARPGASPFYTQVTTDTRGRAEMQIEMDETSLPDSAVLVQANYSGRTATRKFLLRKVEA